MGDFQIRVRDVLDDLSMILVKKNTDYGDSYAKSVDKHGEVVMLIRLEDKLNRLNTLVKSGKNEVGESIADTLLDLAGYAILELERRSR